MGWTFPPEDVYRRMPEEIPTTSLPQGEVIYRTFEQIRECGYRFVLAVLFSSGISGTYNAVRLAAEEFPGLEIRVFDTRTASLGLGDCASGCPIHPSGEILAGNAGNCAFPDSEYEGLFLRGYAGISAPGRTDWKNQLRGRFGFADQADPYLFRGRATD